MNNGKKNPDAASIDLRKEVKPADAQEWEYVNILVSGNDMIGALNVAGSKGWEAWAVMGKVPEGIVVAFKRRKSLIQVATSLGGITR